jgi:transcriptional regulator with XRE-family HTH domain
MKSFGETIRHLRETRGLLLREVAAKMEIDPSLLSRVENGAKRPTRDQVVELASILQQDKDALLIQYLGERVVYELKDEAALAMDAIMVAEKRIRYVTGNSTKKKRQGGAAGS